MGAQNRGGHKERRRRTNLAVGRSIEAKTGYTKIGEYLRTEEDGAESGRGSSTEEKITQERKEKEKGRKE